MTKSKHNNKKSGKQSKFVPAKIPKKRFKQMMAVRKYYADRSKNPLKGKKNASVHQTNVELTVSEENRYGSHVFTDKYPHFRYFRRGKHPALVVTLTDSNNGDGKVYGYHATTHGESGVDRTQYIGKSIVKDKHGRSYRVIYPNPDEDDKYPMLVICRRRYSSPTNFADDPLAWNCPDIDFERSEEEETEDDST